MIWARSRFTQPAKGREEELEAEVRWYDRVLGHYDLNGREFLPAIELRSSQALQYSRSLRLSLLAPHALRQALDHGL